MRIIHRSSLNTNFQNGTAYECNRAWKILIAYLCGSISSAILVCRLLGCPIREPAAPAIQAQPMCYYRWQGSSRSSTDFRRSERNVPVWGAYELGVSPFWLGLIATPPVLDTSGPFSSDLKEEKACYRFWCHRTHWLGSHRSNGGTWLLTVLLSGYSSLGAIVSD